MKKRWILPLLTAMLLSMTACNGGGTESVATTDPTDATEATTEAPEEVTEAPTEEETVPTNAAFPEADPNAVTFDDGRCDFVKIFCDDDLAADGTLSVETVDGNAMLKFTDTKTNAENVGTIVMKLLVDAKSLLAPEDLEKVSSIRFDIGAKAEGELLVGDDGTAMKVPGWIGGGGGTIAADGNWYGFGDFSASNIQEYALERSDMYNVEFKFLLASAGKNWNGTMEEANLQIMRWGVQNASSTYIDNITFYDADGNSIPLTMAPAAEGETDAPEAAE
ncbi:MAG: hypothetical protein E7504_06450 [Ruminococcus sp.]|nr:hypothetical protein [Ruminococcus sp.]